jgi:hypothetical protein
VPCGYQEAIDSVARFSPGPEQHGAVPGENARRFLGLDEGTRAGPDR